jgi:hypothetical protein
MTSGVTVGYRNLIVFGGFMKRRFDILALIAVFAVMFTIVCEKAKEYTFTYNPPLGLEYIETTVSKEKLEMNEEKYKTEETDIKARYFIEAIDSNFLITSEDMSIKYSVNGEPVDEPLIEFMENLEYQLEVDKNGQLVGIYGIEGAPDSMYSQYEPEVRELMSRFFNEDFFYAVIIDDWKKYIGNFVGKNFFLGDKWTIVDTLQLLLGPLAIIEKTVTFTEILGCDKNQCVRIEIEYSAEPDIPKEVFMEFLASLMNAGLDDSLHAEVRSLKIHGMEERIIDPITMLIYSEYEEKITEFEINTKSEGRFSFRKEEIDESSFEYYLKTD